MAVRVSESNTTPSSGSPVHVGALISQRQLLLVPLSGPESAGLLHCQTFAAGTGPPGSVAGVVIDDPLRSSYRPTVVVPRLAVARIWALCLRSMSSDAEAATQRR